MNSLPKTVTRQRRGCDLNPGPSTPESSMLTPRLNELEEGLGIGDIITAVELNRLQWYGHVLRKDDSDCVKKCTECTLKCVRPLFLMCATGVYFYLMFYVLPSVL